MSVESMAIALHHSRAKGSAKLILLGIANHDGDGGAWPSQATLAKYAGGLTRARVKAATDSLVELGEITVHKNGGGGVGLMEWERPHLYRFTLKCPESCDRTPQHRDRRKHAIVFDAALPAIPGWGIEIPHQVSDEYPQPVLPAQQEPPSKPAIKIEKASHSTRECAKGHALLPEGRYCFMGCFVGDEAST